MNGTGFSATDLDALQRQLAAWRRRRQGRARLPDELWAAAAVLAQARGVSGVARTLGLDYYQLRRRCDAGPAVAAVTPASPRFVEVRLEEALAQDRGSFRVELAGPCGTRMTIELGRDVPAVVTLAEAFWRRTR